MHRLQIDIPAPLRQIVSVAHPVAKLGTAPANVTHLRHLDILLLIYFSQFTTISAATAESYCHTHRFLSII
jgi:hypothetical protein